MILRLRPVPLEMGDALHLLGVPETNQTGKRVGEKNRRGRTRGEDLGRSVTTRKRELWLAVVIIIYF